MTVIAGRPVPAPPGSRAASQEPARASGRPATKADRGEFAGMLTRLDSGPPPTFRQSRDGSDEPVSFAAMPLVAPASVEPVDEAEYGRTAEQELARPAASAPAALVGGMTDIDARGPTLQPCAPVPPRLARNEMMVEAVRAVEAQAVLEAGAPVPGSHIAVLPSASGREVAADPTRRAKPAEIRSVQTLATFDLGGGVTVHLAADPVYPRVLVRGAPGEAVTRSEITARIVRLMRGHGFAVSEASVEYQQGRSE